MKRVRKQCYDLRFEDLDQYPFWEFALDEEGRAGQDEATVRPAPRRRGNPTADGPLIVLAVFEFPNGRVRFGQLTIGTGANVGDVQPALFLPKGLLNFYLGSLPPRPRELQRRMKMLRAIASDIFPIHYHTALRDKRGEPLHRGVLKGFYRYGGFGRPAKQVSLTSSAGARGR